MASTMASFTTADRRKKIVTYGKKPRPSIIPTPPTNIAEEPPSPERPRKTVVRKNEGLESGRGALKFTKAPGDTRPTRNDHDIFEVPSDDEFTFRPIKHAKSLSKHRIANNDIPASVSSNDTTTRVRRHVLADAAKQPPKPKTAKPTVPNEKLVHQADQLTVRAPEVPQAHDSINVPPVRSGKTLQPKQDVKKDKVVKQSVTKNKIASRATTPAAPASKPTPTTALKKAANTSTKQTREDLDIYDVPPSDDEAVLPLRKPLRVGRNVEVKEPVKESGKTKHEPLKNDSDDSNASRKRKRRGSVSSVNTVNAGVDRRPDTSVLQRSRKMQRKEDGASPGRTQSKPSKATVPPTRVPLTIPVINKPKRTRQLTVPVFATRTMNKGQSSPAQLSGMLPGNSAVRPSPALDPPGSPKMEDETMYEIPDALTTPVRSSQTTIPGSITPRQKALFGSLLGGSSSKTPMPSLASLTLTDQKPKTLLGALSKAKSDLTHSAQTRKTRLIDTLKNEDVGSEEDEDVDVSDEESETSSDRSVREESTGLRSSEGWRTWPTEAQVSANVDAEEMDVETGPTVESQTSQSTSALGSRAKFTYAKTRSYLQEANPEDALLIMDDDFGFDSQTKDGLSGDEEDPASQVQAAHVLKRKGQQNHFNDDVRMYVDDLPIESGNAVRRSAILELCTRMEDEAFVNQLLDSALANPFFGNINSNGEIIFDIATAVTISLLLRANSTSVTLDQVYQAGVVPGLIKLTSNEVDIVSIAKNRKTNLSPIAVGSVKTLHQRLLASSLWSNSKPVKITPQVLALKALDSLIVGLRQSGSVEPLLDQEQVSSLIDIATKTCAHIGDDKAPVNDYTVLFLVISVLESVSSSRQKQSLWSIKNIERVSEFMPVVLDLEDTFSTILALKLCMHLTNNKPKACFPFSGRKFVQTLACTVTRNFKRLGSELTQEERITVLEILILSLGALINLAEFSDQARLNVDDGQEMVKTLVRIFLEGSERAAQAQSMEESQSNVPVGYLAVLLGNLSLNRSIKTRVCVQLPDQRLDLLITKIREFVQYHEHVDSKSTQYEGAEGRETWQNYTARLMLVVEKLERTEK
ncbi:hypothetical protein NX059_002213 [Plenodomus lindquistii]|nr:hypothetical protein NX059_002213 [Plenodomus lindquistii]